MRRVLVLWTSLGLLGAALGCSHLRGVCDCDIPAPGPKPPQDSHHPGGLIPASHDADLPAPVQTGMPVHTDMPAPDVKGEVLKEMPRPVDKDDKTPPAKPDDKDSKDSKEGKGSKEGKDNKDGQDSKETPMKPGTPTDSRE
jgi:hypothetical protein